MSSDQGSVTGVVMEERRSQAQEDRFNKLSELRRRGIEPYGYGYDVTHSSAEARALLAQAEAEGLKATQAVRVAGRIMSLRAHGKATFADLSDREGQIQLFIRQNLVGDAAYQLVPLLDPGDWIGAEGTVMKTRTGEVSVQVTALTLLSKSLRPLPIPKEEVDEATGARVVHGAFADIEQRYR
ncbi:MAG: OB-fold nucleic acid binding domain-containing protein, partial [Longimicrobiales bacterium]